MTTGHLGRPVYNWLVRLAPKQGELIEYPISNYWSPDWGNMEFEIGNTAMAELSAATREPYAVASVERIS